MSEEKRPISRLSVSQVLLIILGCVSLGALGWYIFSPFRGQDEIEFSKEAWDKGSPQKRGTMARDLLQKGLLPGRTREEIIVLLGEPDSRSDDFFSYRVGPMGFNPNLPVGGEYFLKVEFDSRGKATEADIHD